MFVEPLPNVGFGPLRSAVDGAAAADLTRPAADADDAALADYISQGPLLASCGITAAEVEDSVAKWKFMGDRLVQQLQFDPTSLSPAERSRIYHYYLPAFFWVARQLQEHRTKHAASGAAVPALVVGISAPQGCGKSTLVEQLEELFNWLEQPAASVSVDDFYLTHQDQNQLAATLQGNKLLQYRGNAGSHDLPLGSETLTTLRNLTTPAATAQVPRYDKSAFSGRGDRADPAAWPTVKGPLQLVLFEGWMLGFRPLAEGPEAARAVDQDLVEVDRKLREYQAAWDAHVDSWLVIRVGDPKWVFNWRLQAEERMIAAGKAGMTADQIKDFVDRFMPAYQAYLPGLYKEGPTTARAGHTLVVEVDESRTPVTPQPAPIL